MPPMGGPTIEPIPTPQPTVGTSAHGMTQEESSEMSATPSEYECVLDYRERKTS